MTTIRGRSKNLVSLQGFANSGIPEALTTLDLHCPYKRQYILRMAIQINGGGYILPPELDWLRPLFDASLIHQRTVLEANHPFCYITVRHGLVDSTTDDEWHVDGFSTRVPHTPEQNYVWCNRIGTEYHPTDVVFPCDFDPIKHNVNSYLQQSVNPFLVRNCYEKTLYCLDPYLLHRRPKITGGMMRTFVRVSFVPIEIDDINNTQNPLLPQKYTRDGVEHRNTLVNYS